MSPGRAVFFFLPPEYLDTFLDTPRGSEQPKGFSSVVSYLSSGVSKTSREHWESVSNPEHQTSLPMPLPGLAYWSPIPRVPSAWCIMHGTRAPGLQWPRRTQIMSPGISRSSQSGLRLLAPLPQLQGPWMTQAFLKFLRSILFVSGTNPFMSLARSVLGTCCALSSGTCLHKLFSSHSEVADPWDTTGLSYRSGEAVTTRHDVHSHPLLHCLLFKFLLQVPLLPSAPTHTTDPTLPGFSYSLLAIL